MSDRVFTFEEVCLFPPSLPLKKQYQKVWGPTFKKKMKENCSIFQSVSIGRSMKFWEIYRELYQNLFDQAAISNSLTETPSFTGIDIITGERDELVVTIFYSPTRQLRYAEVIYDDLSQTVWFVNFGAVIVNFNQLFGQGGSKKYMQSRQIGRYGEGAKRAFACALNNDCTVEVSAVVLQKGHSEFRKWTLAVDGHDVMRISESRPPPLEKDPHCFIVCLGNVPEIPNERLFMLRDMSALRDPENDQVVGHLLTHPSEQGRLYGWHFWVEDKSNSTLLSAFFGYDIFSDIVPRERRAFYTNELVPVVASIWDDEITSNPDRAKLFYDSVICAAHDKNSTKDYVEWKAIEYLGKRSKGILLGIFQEKHGPDAVAVTKEDGFFAKLQLHLKFATITHKAIQLFIGSFPRHYYSTRLQMEENAFKGELIQNNEAIELLNKVFADVVILVALSIPDSPTKFVHLKESNRLVLNWHFFEALTLDQQVSKIYVQILPFVLKSHDFDLVSIMEKIRILLAPPPPSPPPRYIPPNKRARPENDEEIVIDDQEVDDILFPAMDMDSDDDAAAADLENGRILFDGYERINPKNLIILKRK